MYDAHFYKHTKSDKEKMLVTRNWQVISIKKVHDFVNKFRKLLQQAGSLRTDGFRRRRPLCQDKVIIYTNKTTWQVTNLIPVRR